MVDSLEDIMHARVVIIGLIALGSPLVGSSAQDTTATLTGRVTDSAGVALAGTMVGVNRVGPRVETDAAGRFRIAGILPGDRIIVIQHPRYHSATVKLSLRRGETRDTTVKLDRLPVPLDTVVTEARAMSENLRRNGFYTRQRMGFGYFLDRDAIAKMRVFDVVDVLRRVPFVEVAGRPGTPLLLMRGGTCRPMVYLDGNPDPFFSDIPVQMVDGMEVYRNATGVPIELARGRTPCGAVLIWTR